MDVRCEYVDDVNARGVTCKYCNDWRDHPVNRVCPILKARRDGTNPPPIRRRVVSYAESTAKWVAAGSPARTDDEVATILEICKACNPHYQPRANGTGVCNLCGCNLNLYGGWRSKPRRGTEHCPKGKW